MTGNYPPGTGRTIPIPPEAIESDEAWYMIIKHAHGVAEHNRNENTTQR